ncbi:membrane protein [Nonomuraea glycinis]|uniref:Membrane protein n=1 Tax=Nonomuraea glycinis TaxID=2047744 RepID=A0A918A7L9_9ACTN|nr:membrane protein [Nonomuraea glycinis]
MSSVAVFPVLGPSLGGAVPLSEHEQRLLDQIEQALYAEDPKWANTVRISDPRSHYKRRLVKASIGFVLGVVLLMVGVVINLIPLGVGGFVVMLAACLWGLSSWKRMNGFGDSASASGASAPGKQVRRGGNRGSFMERMEERWRRRHDEH